MEKASTVQGFLFPFFVFGFFSSSCDSKPTPESSLHSPPLHKALRTPRSMPLSSFSDDAQRVAGGPPSLFSGASRPDGATAVALAAATALQRCGWSMSSTASAALSPAAASAPWPGRPGSTEWVFAFEW